LQILDICSILYSDPS